jgi:hypothetical protein
VGYLTLSRAIICQFAVRAAFEVLLVSGSTLVTLTALVLINRRFFKAFHGFSKSQRETNENRKHTVRTVILTEREAGSVRTERWTYDLGRATEGQTTWGNIRARTQRS